MKLFAKKGKKFVTKLIILSVIAYCVYLFINQRVKIKIKNDEFNYINKQIEIEKQKNEEIREKLDQASNGNENNNTRTRTFENVAE